MLFMMLMLGVVSAVMAQGNDVPATDYDAMIGTFAGFAAGVVVLDKRSNPVFKASEKKISVDPASVTLEATGGSEEVTVTASGEYEIGSAPAGFKVEATDNGVKISAGANSGSQKTGTLTLTLNADRSKTAKITITQNQKG